MADVRVTVDHDQLKLVLGVMDEYLEEAPRGEIHHLMHGIVGGLALRLRKKMAERRLEYKLILPVHQAIALRRMALVGQELYTEQRQVMEMILLAGNLDEKMTNILHVR